MDNQRKFLIDNVSHHETPEGVLLTLMPAGVTSRATAWIIDYFIKACVLFGLSIALWSMDSFGAGLFSICFFLTEWLYPVFFEVFHSGMTPGKKIKGIYVCHDDGTAISFQSSMTRNLLRFAEFLPGMYMTAIVSMLVSKKSQRIGDMLAGTIVVYKEQNDLAAMYQAIYGKKNIQQSQGKDSQAPISLNVNENTNTDELSRTSLFEPDSPIMHFPLSFTEQQSMLGLTDRLGFLSEQRQLELAANLSPLVKMKHPQQRIQQLPAHSPQQLPQAALQAVIHRSEKIKGTS